MRIHQNDIQEKMFEKLGFTEESAYEQFGFLLMPSNTVFRLMQDWLTDLTAWLC